MNEKLKKKISSAKDKTRKFIADHEHVMVFTLMTTATVIACASSLSQTKKLKRVTADAKNDMVFAGWVNACVNKIGEGQKGDIWREGNTIYIRQPVKEETVND